MSTNAEIARLLRTTDDNAARFVERVRAEVGDPISDEDLVEIIRGINPRQLSLPKVIHAVRDYHKRLAARAAKRAARKATSKRATASATEGEGTPAVEPETGGENGREAAEPRRKREVALVKSRSSSSLVSRIAEILERNWSRAEREGFKPERLNPEDFINTVRDYTDPRDATHARILAAVQELDRADVLITPTVAADRVRELAY